MSTSTRSQLPQECIRLIVAHLHDDIFTLYQLLTVHSTFFNAVLPILYLDPYRTLETQLYNQAMRRGEGRADGFSTSLRAKRLLYLLLLSCRNADDLVPFLSIDWPDPLSPIVSESPLTVPYIDYLGDLDFDRWATTFKQFVCEFDKLMEEHAYRIFRLLFLEHHKERVRYLSIPVTHLEPYELLLPHLKNLQRIRFYEDELEDIPNDPSQEETTQNDNTQEGENDGGGDINDIVDIDGEDGNNEDAIEAQAERAAEEPIVEPIEESVEEQVEEQVAEPIEEPVVEPVMEPVEEPVAEPAEAEVEVEVEVEFNDNHDSEAAVEATTDTNDENNTEAVVEVEAEANGDGNNEAEGNENGGNGNENENQDGNNNDNVNENENETPAPSRPPYDPTPRAVSFIRSHRTLFNPSRVPEFAANTHINRMKREHDRCGYGLLEVEVPRSWIHSGWSDRVTYDSRYIQILEAMESPSVVHVGEWEHFSQHFDSAPLDGLKRITHICDAPRPGTQWQADTLLRRCRSLEKFGGLVSASNMFQWAAEERKDRETYESLVRKGAAGSASSLGQGLSHGGHYGPGLAPVPLRKVYFAHFIGQDMYPILKDICYGFYQTLESIKLVKDPSSTQTSLSVFCDLPRLKTLYIHYAGEPQLINSPLFLRGCPNLEVLRLEDSYNNRLDTLRETNFDVYEPWSLPNLQELFLVGTMCEAFNYATLASTPQLRSLRLECEFDGIGVRSVSEEYKELLSQPSWAWDWELPNLRHMVLTGAPAHLFRFSQLAKCPKLERAVIDVYDVPRTISRSKDFLPQISTTHSSIRSLALNGFWIMNESSELFTDLLQQWFPHIHYLKLDATEFYDNKSIVDGLRSISNLKKATLRRHRLCEYDVWKLNLEEVDLKCPREWDRKYRSELIQKSAQERRRLIREQRLLIWERERKKYEVLLEKARLLKWRRSKKLEDVFDIMSTAFSFLEETDEIPEGSVCSDADEQGEPEQPKERVRCESVDSGCTLSSDDGNDSDKDEVEELEEALRRADEEAKEELEMEAKEEEEARIVDIWQSQRCVLMFRGKRYHFKEVYPGHL